MIDGTTSVEAIAAALLLQPEWIDQVYERLQGKAIRDDLYHVQDVLDACRIVERDHGHVYIGDLTTIEAVAELRGYSPEQTAHLRELLRGRPRWRDEYRTVDVLAACLAVEGEDVGWAA